MQTVVVSVQCGIELCSSKSCLWLLSSSFRNLRLEAGATSNWAHRERNGRVWLTSGSSTNLSISDRCSSDMCCLIIDRTNLSVRPITFNSWQSARKKMNYSSKTIEHVVTARRTDSRMLLAPAGFQTGKMMMKVAVWITAMEIVLKPMPMSMRRRMSWDLIYRCFGEPWISPGQSSLDNKWVSLIASFVIYCVCSRNVFRILLELFWIT